MNSKPRNIVKRIDEDENTLILVLRALKVDAALVVETAVKGLPLMQVMVKCIREGRNATDE